MPSYTSFEELDCWQRCRDVRIWVESFIHTNINKGDFDMIQNIRRAARSTTRNIAEGFGRFHYKENIQYCRISRGSLFEIKDDLICCLDEKKAIRTEVQEGLNLISKAVHSVNGYIKYLESKIK